MFRITGCGSSRRDAAERITSRCGCSVLRGGRRVSLDQPLAAGRKLTKVSWMPQSLSLVTLLVADYDEAISFYMGKLGFELRQDIPLTAHKRWVVVAPPGAAGGLLLARAVGDRQRLQVGDQSGGRVFLFLETDDFTRDYLAYTRQGIRFVEPPRREPYGIVAVFEDMYGNHWDLIEPISGSADAI